MFTGLIEDVGELVARRSLGRSGKLEVRTGLPLDEVCPGDSVAVNGACLTVESVDTGSRTLAFHTLAETLDRTSLGARPVGSEVNLERALRLGDRLGGHLVQGHVDATGAVLAIDRRADDLVVRIGLPESIRHLVIPKGSIAVDGISLTIADLGREWFEVRIIPHTWSATDLRSARPGDAVNLEADMLGKYVLRQREFASGGSVTEESLRQAGFEV